MAVRFDPLARGASLLAAATLATMVCLSSPLTRPEDSMDASRLSCTIELTPAGGGEVALAFGLRNPGEQPVTVRYFRPFVGFALTARAEDGDVRIVQPAYDSGVQRVTATLAPGETVRLATPFRLRFDPNVPPSGGDVPTRWSLRHAPVPVVLRATLDLSGATVEPCETRWDPGTTG